MNRSENVKAVTPVSRLAARVQIRPGALLFLLAICSQVGCTALFIPIDSIPARRVPKRFLAERQADKVPIDVARLRQPKPPYYILDKEDVLGVFIEGVLGNEDEAPPVQLPEPGSDLPPAMGFPVPVREDGTVSLPLVDPIPVRGLTIQQAEELIKRTYVENGLVQPETRSIVTLLRERTYRVFVVRQDNQLYSNPQFAANRSGRGNMQGINAPSDFSSRGFVLQLPAGRNDVLNALSDTGGMPGVNAKAEVRILRGGGQDFADRDAQLRQFYQSNDPSQFPYGIVPPQSDVQNTLRIPLRLRPGEVPRFKMEDIILRDGDIVYVDNRETEVYYTGGLLGGGEFALPRDYDLDVLTAVARSGQSPLGVGNSQQGLGGLIATVGTMPPTDLIVLRPLPAQRQIAIKVDMKRALNDPRERLLVRAGDTLILRYKPCEEAVNFGIASFFTFGIRQLFQ